MKYLLYEKPEIQLPCLILQDADFTTSFTEYYGMNPSKYIGKFIN
jgi:hypothetical protein